jgi:hypothetical protein
MRRQLLLKLTELLGLFERILIKLLLFAHRVHLAVQRALELWRALARAS